MVVILLLLQEIKNLNNNLPIGVVPAPARHSILAHGMNNILCRKVTGSCNHCLSNRAAALSILIQCRHQELTDLPPGESHHQLLRHLTRSIAAFTIAVYFHLCMSPFTTEILVHENRFVPREQFFFEREQPLFLHNPPAYPTRSFLTDYPVTGHHDTNGSFHSQMHSADHFGFPSRRDKCW